MHVKTLTSSFIGIVGGGILMALGGWDDCLKLLVILMFVDYASGFAVAVTGNSPKTENGGISSKAGIMGLFRKIMELAFVMIGHQIDAATGIGYIRNAIIIGFAVNEMISVMENAGLMGLPLPSAVTKALDVLKSKVSTDDDDDNNEEAV